MSRVVLRFACKNCPTDFIFENYIPEKIICLDCETEYTGNEIIKEVKHKGNNNDR